MMQAKNRFEKSRLKHLETLRSIDVEEDWRKVQRRMGFGKKRTLTRIWQAAAAVIVLLGVGFLAHRTILHTPEMIIASAGAHPVEVTLPDGSEVTLNRLATLTYPERFRRAKREVLLTGEAFFDVDPDTRRPFLVRVEHKATVEVLGTSFNIKPDKTDRSITVQVVEGRVAFSVTENEPSAMIITKDEQATLVNGKIILESVLNKNLMSWKTGILFFDQSPIGDVIRQLEAHYGRSILLEKSVSQEMTFTSTIDNQDLESILEEMKLVLKLDIEIENGMIIISSLK